MIAQESEQYGFTIGSKNLAQAVKAVLEELRRAEVLYPSWPTDRVEQAAIVIEEAGEAIQAALNLRPHDKHQPDTSVEDFRTELVQTAAMAIRALMSLEE